MKAIKTHYKGYPFRSRLEARWAVFFDVMGIIWRYETEGYDLDGFWYLPDFFLPLEDSPYKEAGYWIEIKPRPLTIAEEEKVKRLVFHTGHNAFALAGNVGLGEYAVSKWGLRRQTKEVWRIAHNVKGDLYYNDSPMWMPVAKDASKYEQAVTAARMARFEHGEKPAIPKPEAPSTEYREYTQKLFENYHPKHEDSPPKEIKVTRRCAYPFEDCKYGGVYYIGNERYICFIHRLKWLDRLTFKPESLSKKERALQRTLGNLK